MNKRYQAFNWTTAWMLLLLTFGLMTVSCIDETFVGEGGNKHAEDRMAVRLTISTPATQKPETRSTEQEEQIEEICILVLSRQSADTEYQFLYSVEGININRPNSNTTTFTAMLGKRPDQVHTDRQRQPNHSGEVSRCRRYRNSSQRETGVRNG